MRKAQSRSCLVFVCKISKFLNYNDKSLADEFETFAHEDDISVVTYIVGCGAKVDDALRFRTLNTLCIDMAHNIVSSLLLLLRSNFIVDIVSVSFEFIDLGLSDI